VGGLTAQQHLRGGAVVRVLVAWVKLRDGARLGLVPGVPSVVIAAGPVRRVQTSDSRQNRTDATQGESQPARQARTRCRATTSRRERWMRWGSSLPGTRACLSRTDARGVRVSWAGRACQLGGACVSVGRGVLVSWAGRPGVRVCVCVCVCVQQQPATPPRPSASTGSARGGMTGKRRVLRQLSSGAVLPSPAGHARRGRLGGRWSRGKGENQTK
jgi:hypothetical protein